MVNVVKYRFEDTTYHTHTHFIFRLLENCKSVGKSLNKLSRVEDVVLDHVLAVVGLFHDLGEVVFVWHLKLFFAADLQVVFANLFTN